MTCSVVRIVIIKYGVGLSGAYGVHFQ